MSKKIIIAVLMVAMSLGSFAQQRTTRLTLYRQFKPSTITLKTGQKIKQSLTNVFLKNSTLVYLKDEYTMEANMDNIAAVEFDDRTFVNINNPSTTSWPILSILLVATAFTVSTSSIWMPTTPSCAIT